MTRLLCLLILIGLTGCEPSDDVKSFVAKAELYPKAEPVGRITGGSYVYKIKIEGHDYLCLYDGGIIHSESCSCRKEKPQ